MKLKALSLYDGAPKYLTKDCADCPFFLSGHGAARLTAAVKFPKKYRAMGPAPRFCAWGVAVKRLVDHEKPPRACALRAEASPGIKGWMELLNQPELNGQQELIS